MYHRVKGALSGFKNFLATESPLKVIKNTFYLTLKSIFVLKIFKFLCDLLVMKRNSRIITIRLILKYMTSQRGKQTIAIHTLPNTSRSKSNQTMTFGQFIEYNMRSIFLKNYTPNLLEKLFQDTFPRNQKWAYLLINSLMFYRICFYCISSWGLSKYIESKLQNTFFYLEYSFLKNKKRSGTSLPASFSQWFLKKNLSLDIFDQLAKCYFLVIFTSWDVRQYVYCNCLFPRLGPHKFWI